MAQDPYSYDPSQDSALQRKYDIQRQRVNQDATKASQENNNSLQRKFASLGMVNSGESIKQQQLGQEQVNQQSENAKQNVDVQQAGEESMKSAQALQNQFAKSERIGSQEYATGERLGSQQFQSGEAQKARDFSEGQFQAEMGFKQKLQDFAESSFSKQFEEGKSQFAQTFDQNERAQQFNQDMANRVFNKKDMLESFFNQGSSNSLKGGAKSYYGATNPNAGTYGGFNPTNQF